MKTGLESLDTGAPEITYSGNQGPKSPQEDQQKMQEFQMAQLKEEYDAYVDDMIEQGIQPMSMQQFLEQIAAEAQMSSNEEGIGSMMQDPRTMAAFGGIMGADGRRAYIGGSHSDKGGYQGGGDGKGGKAGGEGTGTDGQGGTGGGDREDNPGDRGNFNRETGTESQTPSQYTKDDIREQYRVGNTDVTVGDDVPFAKEYIGGREYDVIPNDPANALVRQRANESVAADRAAKFNEMRRRELEEQRRRLALMNQGGGGGGQNPYYGDDEDDDEDDDNNAFPDIPTNFVDLSGSQSYTNPAFENEFFYGTPTITLANGGRANFAGGGIADLRQGYFLGKLVKSITKPFKKAFKGFKKIAKSPMGRMALLALGGYYAGGGNLFGLQRAGLSTPGFSMSNLPGANFFTGGSKTANLAPKIVTRSTTAPLQMGVTKAKTALDSGNFLTKSLGFMKDNPFATISGISGLSGLYTNYINNKREDESMADYQRRLEIERGNFAPIPVDPVQFAADGGLMGDDDDDDDIGSRSALAKATKFYAFGGLAGLPPVTMAPTGQNIQSFPDDESTNMNQGPTMQSQMPMKRPMMDPRMMQKQGGMNPMMGNRMMAAMGGRMGYAEGGESELLDMGGMEKDYRNDGGFVPMGEYERKDDVPARLSKNEFVFTADAVRNAGGGDIDKGAEIMENMMTNLENGGKVSQGSQGLDGAREMFQTQQRLGEVL